uniref:Pseudouridine synthase I TruA alpha/beta domain-containing protein n=1 Tax=Monopterus albus TaxID=43700 RepID=A0A3Q3KE39_MONAL
MSQTLIQQIKELEGELEKLKCQLKERREAGEDSKKASKERPFDFSAHPRRHVALRLAYLGWAYQGFAVQENTENTVEARLFEALLKTRLIQDRQSSNYHRCGRTDKGVSAFSQVITIDLRSTQFCGGLGIRLPENVDVNPKKKADVPELPYVKILNRVLPQDIRILDWAPVAEGFSARFDCQSRTYRYYFPRGSLDVALMADAAKKYEGTHDFRNLCKMDVEVKPVQPQHIMAVDYPLVLYDCHFEGLSWKRDAEEVNHVLSALQQQWTQSAVKAQILHGMIQGLDCHWSPSIGGLSSDHCSLIEGSRQRNYRPLLERPCCESLESRIDHFVKRGRLEREEGENGGEMVHRGKRSKHSHYSSNLPVSSEMPTSKQSTDHKAD